jgi:DNA-binding NtrC family response regulator
MAKKRRLACIVEDDIDILQLYYDALKDIAGITLFKFTNPIVALEHVRTNKNSYVLVLADLRMPELNGVDLIKRIKDLNDKIRTILITAFDASDIGINEYLKKEVVNGLIQKPIKIARLRLEINNQLSAYES